MGSGASSTGCRLARLGWAWPGWACAFGGEVRAGERLEERAGRFRERVFELAIGVVSSALIAADRGQPIVGNREAASPASDLLARL